MQNLKQKTVAALMKILQSIQHKEKEKDQPTQQINDNPQNLKNQFAINNQNSNEVNKKMSEFIEIYGSKLNAQENMLVQITYQNQLDVIMDVKKFKETIKQSIQKLTPQSINQFQNVTSNPFEGVPMNKTIKAKKKKQVNSSARKTEPTVESHPEYYRVDHELAHKLFLHYRTLPLGISSSGSLSFEEKQLYKSALNYHKVLQIFKDAGTTLEINQKLLILRSIKKFAFNQNMISQQEFVKIFKVFIHGLGYKEKLFEDLIVKKIIDGSYCGEKKKRKSVSHSKPQRIYRFKTQNAIDRTMNEKKDIISRIKNGQMNVNQKSRVSSFQFTGNQSGVNRQTLKRNQKTESKHKLGTIRETRSGSTGSYLLKAMDHQKISKITWESLFAMKQSNMHFNIVIPDICRGIEELQTF